MERPLSDTPIYTTVAAQLTSCLALVNPKTHSEEPHRSLETDTLGVTQPRHTLYGPNHAKVWRSIGLATCVSGSWQFSSSVRPLPKELGMSKPRNVLSDIYSIEAKLCPTCVGNKLSRVDPSDSTMIHWEPTKTYQTSRLTRDQDSRGSSKRPPVLMCQLGAPKNHPLNQLGHGKSMFSGVRNLRGKHKFKCKLNLSEAECTTWFHWQSTLW